MRKYTPADGLWNEDGCWDPDERVVYFADEVDAEIARLKAEAESTWRCFHCGEVCKSEVDGRNHFGSLDGSETACSIKAAGEFALLQALRNAEERLHRYAAEDSDTMRAMASMQSDHNAALRREEEAGYGKAVAHMRAESELLKAALRWSLENDAVIFGLAPLRIVTDYGSREEPPAHLAAVIAEAVEQATKGPTNV